MTAPAGSAKIRRVLVGTDFSDAARDALRWAMRVLGNEPELVLGHVVDIPRPPGFLASRLPPYEELNETAAVGARTRLEGMLDDLPGHARAVVRSGRPAEQLAAIAAELNVDLIVVGEHGPRRRLWELLGSTAEKLVHLSETPVLIVRGGSGTAAPTILAPLDESPDPIRALAWTAAFARMLDAEVVAMHVLDPAITGRIRLVSSYGVYRGFEQELVTRTRDWLVSRTRDAGVPVETVEALVVIGNAAQEIVAAAERIEAGLIVMASHGVGRPQSTLGSVGRAVLRGAVCPILLVPAGTPTERSSGSALRR